MVVSKGKISVVVPIYNSEIYLEKCVQSVLMQSYRNFELILVDDGSRDESGVICDKFAKSDARIRVFHNSNKGVSTARNFGIDVSTGEWITFLDSDDWLEVDYLEKLIRGNEENDLVVSYYYAIGWDKWASEPWESRLYNKENIRDSFAHNMKEFSFVCSKMYKTSIIKGFGIRFNSNISYSEDSIFTFTYLQYTNTVKIQSDALYCYNCYPAESLTTKSWSWESAAYTIEQMYNALSSLELRYNWDGCATKNFYTWAFLKRYLSGIVPHNTILQTRNVLVDISKNNIVAKLFKSNARVKNKLRVLFNFLMCHKLYLLGAIMLHLENNISRKK